MQETASNRIPRLLWWLPAFAYASAIITMAAVNASWRLPGRLTDKLVHFALYGVLSCLLYLPLHKQAGRGTFFITVALCAMIGTLDESIQYFNPSRTASLGDLMADLAGSLGGAAICAVLPLRSKKA